MKLLLDTHSFLWFIGGDERLSPTGRMLIEDVNNDVFLSVASLWEMAIKISLGRLRLAQPFETFIPQQIS
jgi:PIN domain nuclease of toxin-antitoxin system